MDTSKLFAVEYNPERQEWRIDTLEKILTANYEHFLSKSPLKKPPSLFEPDWVLLGVCASLEEANALADKFQEIRDKFDQDMEKVGFPS